jgi:acyl-CoA synthetase (AMP-forming)/AMP-acid ligase II
VLDVLLELLDGGDRVAIRATPERELVTRRQLIADIRAFADDCGEPDPATGCETWIAVHDPYLLLVGTLGSLRLGTCALVEPRAGAAHYDMLAGGRPPRLLVSDEPEGVAGRWARARGIRIRQVGAADARSGGRPRRDAPAPTGAAIRFFTSGTTGSPRGIAVGVPHLVAAMQGVAGRLELGPEDRSLSLAPLTHTLGLVTTALTALTSGGSVVFGDLSRPPLLGPTIAATAPTWCAASPAAHRLVLEALARPRTCWPGLRLLRSSSAPLVAELAGELEDRFGVPVVNAYAMTEAPGEIASQGLRADRRPGTVGRPTLCQVEVRTEAGERTGGEGHVWISGPNVAAGAADAAGWFETGDVGILDRDGLLRLTGRADDMINQGGLKIWPSEVEAAALRHPAVKTAVAFPVPHDRLGEAVALAVEPRDGQRLDRGDVRRFVMGMLPRPQWPGRIVVCASIPTNARGKVARRSLWREFEGRLP